jgi:hypothetical protein
VIFAAPVLDITPQVLSALQARGVRAPASTGGAAPATPKASAPAAAPKGTTPPK